MFMYSIRFSVNKVLFSHYHHILWGIVLFFALCYHAYSLELRNIRTGDHADYGRIVIEFNKNTIYRLFNLNNPNRLVIDTPQINLSITATSDFKNSRYFSGYRSGLFQQGLSRIVIDLSANHQYKNHFIIKASDGKNFRLVIDVAQQKNNSQRYNYQSNDFEKYLQKITQQQQQNPRPPITKSDKFTIILDPGHGGPDPGAIGIHGNYEKHVTLKMGHLLKKILEKNSNYRVILTRDNDIYLPLRKRFAIAEDYGADLFISIHADKAPNQKTRGATVFTLSEKASDKEAELLAQKENKADLIAGEDLSEYDDDVALILLDLEQRNTLSQSVKFAGILVNSLKQKTQLVRNAHRFAGFAVLKSPSIPSVLVELGFLSNPKEAILLQKQSHLKKLASAIENAIANYQASL